MHIVSEQWVREHIDEISEWELFNIFIDNMYTESFVREIWPLISPTGAIERFHHLSLDFLREMQKDIFWEDMYTYNRHYSKEEWKEITKAFNLDRKFDLI